MDLSEHRVCKDEEVLTDQQLCNQDRNSSLDQEDPALPQVKEEQEEHYISQEEEQLVVKRETDSFMFTLTDEFFCSQTEPNNNQELLSHNSAVTESQDQRQQHYACKEEEEEVLADQQLCDQNRDSNLDQRDSDPRQIKEEQEEHYISQEHEQLVVKQETDSFMFTLTDEFFCSQTEPNDNQELLSPNSAVTDSQDQHQQHYVCKEEQEEVLVDQQLCDQNRDSNLDQRDSDPLKIKKEKEEQYISQEEEQLVVKQETDSFMFTLTDEIYCSQTELNNNQQLFSHKSAVTESQDQRQQHYVCKEEEEEVLADQQLCDPNPDSNQDHSDPLQIKKEQGQHGSSQERETLVVKQETETFTLTDTRMKSEEGEAERLRDKQCLFSACGKRFCDKATLRRHMKIHTATNYISITIGALQRIIYRNEAAMSSVQCLRTFVNERLTAAAEEIFGVFHKTIVEYEEQIRLLEIVWKPEIKLHRIEHHVVKEEEVLADQQVSNQHWNPIADQVDSVPTQVKEDQEEHSLTQEEEELVVKQETDSFILTLSDVEIYDRETESNDNQLLLSHNSPITESQEQLLPQHVCMEEEEEEEVQDQQLYNRNQNSHLDPDPAKTKGEEEEHCSSQVKEQLVVKQKADAFMLIPAHEKTDHREPLPLSDPLFLSDNSQDQKRRKHVDSSSAGNKKERNVHNSNRSETCGVFQKTIAEYEEEIHRQRRLLDMVWKPERNLHRIQLPRQYVCKEQGVLADQRFRNQDQKLRLDQKDPVPQQVKEEQEEHCSRLEEQQLGVKQELQHYVCKEEEEVLIDQQFCNQDKNTSLDRENTDPLQIREEQEEHCTGQEGEQFLLQQETKAIVLTSSCEESDHSEKEPFQKGCNQIDSGSSGNAEPTSKESDGKSFKCDSCGKAFNYRALSTWGLRCIPPLPQVFSPSSPWTVLLLLPLDMASISFSLALLNRSVFAAGTLLINSIIGGRCHPTSNGKERQMDGNMGLSINPAETQCGPETNGTTDPEEGVCYITINFTKKTDRKVQGDDDDEGEAVTYSTVKASSSAAAAASTDPSSLYATIS
ncbi:hypothetical protein Q8A73_018165 [Channa argus]|nr:hypothetical protein Q8A73_018165 [Channa argus]